VPDFKFLKDIKSNSWVILDPKRSIRPNVAKKVVPVCPFCIGNEMSEKEVYRIGGNPGDSNWQIRILNNKFPFAPVHEIIVHSPDHHKNIDELPLSQVELIFTTYVQRAKKYFKKGKVFIFHNRGELGGESIPHPHTQLVVIPNKVTLDIHPVLAAVPNSVKTSFFEIYAPSLSQWPDEVWIVPRRKNTYFWEIFEEEKIDLSYVMQRLIQIMSVRHGEDFPFNYYISPNKNWYLRLIPRKKILGSFEVGTNVWVNTQDPSDTMEFLLSHFENADLDVIRTEHQAEYRRKV